VGPEAGRPQLRPSARESGFKEGLTETAATRCNCDRHTDRGAAVVATFEPHDPNRLAARGADPDPAPRVGEALGQPLEMRRSVDWIPPQGSRPNGRLVCPLEEKVCIGGRRGP